MPLSNIFNNILNELINTFQKENVICCCSIKNAIKPQLLGTRQNNITCYSEIKKSAIKKNKIDSYFKIEKEIKSANRNIFAITFYYLEIIKYN